MIEDVIAGVIDDLFGHRRCSYGTMSPDPDELMLFALEVLKKVGVRDPKKDTPWIKQFIEREKALLAGEALTKKQDCGLVLSRVSLADVQASVSWVRNA